ncbi:MAG: transposase, partial [Akkermansiaceae bacterium]|nr:transposase [Akkermansiaceae bacterium]
MERLRGHGYAGGITILKDWLAEVRPHFREPRQRTSYLPGEIGQLDWWELGVSVPVGKGAHRKAFGLVASLPHSAAHATVFALGKTRADAAPAVVGCLRRLGGVPEGLVVDRDTSLVVPKSRPARLHPELAAVFGALRTRPIILAPRSPESKG